MKTAGIGGVSPQRASFLYRSQFFPYRKVDTLATLRVSYALISSPFNRLSKEPIVLIVKLVHNSLRVNKKE